MAGKEALYKRAIDPRDYDEKRTKIDHHYYLIHQVAKNSIQLFDDGLDEKTVGRVVEILKDSCLRHFQKVPAFLLKDSRKRSAEPGDDRDENGML